MLTFDVLTLFPQLIEGHISELPFKRALDLKKIKINTHNFREFAIDERGSVDDKPYGGGIGMILRVEPIFEALSGIYINFTQDQKDKSQILVLSPKGTRINQPMINNLAGSKTQISVVCGRYEGFDARVAELGGLLGVETVVVSLGDFVMSGGEVPALAIMEGITRVLPGVLEKPHAIEEESFMYDTIEYPQYTRPENFKGLKVPNILLSGDHKKIKEWRKEKSKSF